MPRLWTWTCDIRPHGLNNSCSRVEASGELCECEWHQTRAWEHVMMIGRMGTVNTHTENATTQLFLTQDHGPPREPELSRTI